MNDKLKESRMCLNGRLLLLAVGLMLVFNSLNSTIRNGLTWLDLSRLAVQTQEEIAQEAQNTGEDPSTGTDASDGMVPASDTGASDGMGPASDTDASAGMVPASGTDASAEAQVSAEAVAGTEEDAFDPRELLSRMEEAGITASDLRLFGILFLITAFFEAAAGIFCAVFSNRVDKSRITLAVVITLLAEELIFLAILFFKGGLMLSVLFNSVVLPLILLWAVTRFRKIAKADPERVYAVKPRQTVQKPQAQKKSLKEKASWTTDVSSEAPQAMDDEETPQPPNEEL